MEMVLFSNYYEDTYGNDNKRDFAKQCIKEDFEEIGSKEEITEKIINEWLENDLDYWWQDLSYELDNIFKNQNAVILKVNQSSKEIEKGEIIPSTDCLIDYLGKYDYVRFQSNNGELEILTTNKKENNFFVVRVLTDKGQKYNSDLSYDKYAKDKKEICKKLFQDDDLSKKIFSQEENKEY